MSEALVKSPGRRIAALGNQNAARYGWKSWLRKKALLRTEDKAAIYLAEKLADALASDRGPDMTAGERALIENAAMSRVCVALCFMELGRSAAFTDADGARVASPAVRELAKFLGAERQALQALGVERQVKPLRTLKDIIDAEVVSS